MTLLTSVMGSLLAESFLAVLRGERDLFSSQDESLELKLRFYKY